MSKRVLIIDDDKELCEELSEVISAEGFIADFSLSSSAGKALLRKNSYDILILDYKMSQMNGIELLREIKEEAKNLKIFIISGSLSVEKLIAENNLSDMVAAIFNKPFDVAKLITAIKQ